MTGNDKQLTSEAIKRLTDDSGGQDIVGLTTGEPFDPIGDMDRVIEAAELEEAIAAAEAESPSSPVAKPTPMVLASDAIPKPPTS